MLRPRLDGLDAVASGAVFATCLTLYLRTLTPGLPYPAGDSHELILNAARLGVPHPTGYPLYTWLGYLFIHLPLGGDAAFRMNCMSAVLGAAGVACLVLVARALGVSRVFALGAGLALGLSTTFWSQAVVAEVYAPFTAVLTMTLWLLLAWADHARDATADRRLIGFALFLGLSLGAHMSNLTFAPVYAAFVLIVAPSVLRRPRVIALAAVAFLLGTVQFAWLPLRGGLFDQFPNPRPDTWRGLYDYTIAAAAKQRFGFPLFVFPLRFYFGVMMFVKNFGVIGVALGIVGMWAQVARDPARFWLLAGVFFVNFVFATQLAVPDPDVFFLPGEVIWALFMAIGVDAGWRHLRTRLPINLQPLAHAATVALLAAGLFMMGRASYAANDRHTDTASDDFRANAYALLPPDTWLTTARGAFGADMAYQQVALGERRDVSLFGSQLDAAPPRTTAPHHTTARIFDGRPTPSGRLGHIPDELPENAWYIPVLFGNHHDLALWRLSATPPTLIVPNAPTENRLDRRLGDLTLVTATVALVTDIPRPRLHLRTTWKRTTEARFTIATRLGDTILESHELGLGNLRRYLAEVATPADGLIVEDFDVTVPALLPAGTHPVHIGVTQFTATTITTAWTEVSNVVR